MGKFINAKDITQKIIDLLIAKPKQSLKRLKKLVQKIFNIDWGKWKEIILIFNNFLSNFYICLYYLGLIFFLILILLLYLNHF